MFTIIINSLSVFSLCDNDVLSYATVDSKTHEIVVNIKYKLIQVMGTLYIY